MAGSTLNWNTINIPRGQRVELWAKLAVPGAGARMTIDTATLTPDSTANPTALHLGRTEEGAELRYAPTLQYRSSDEFDSPFDSLIEVVEGVIAATIMPTLDMNIMDVIMVGGTKAVGTGYEEIAFGGKTTVTKTSVAAIFRMPEDPTKVGVFHLYSAINDQALAMRIRKGGNTIGSTPIAFRGFSLSDRAAGDQVGKLWKQVT